MFIDTHCHLTGEYYDDIDKVIEDNKIAGVDKIIVSCCEKKDIDETLFLLNKYDCLYATFGYHPDQAGIIEQKDLKELESILINTKKVVGVGEIGLDYHYGKENIDKQKKLFEKQLSIAEKYKLPVVIHSRDATKDTIDILKKYNVVGVIHCFSGSLETANIYIDMGYKLGIGGVLTFKNSNLYKVLEKIPLESILFETDSPYLAPEPYRGKTNSSKYIPIIAEKVSQIKRININDLSKIILKNTYQVFDLR